MPKLTFIQKDGSQQTIDVASGQSIMEAATAQLVPGIIGDCGGSCSCATCHVYVDPAWTDKLPPADELEVGMLDGVLDPEPTSRLACQLKVADEIDGIVLRVPASQF